MEIKTPLESSENITYQQLWDIVKAVLARQVIATFMPTSRNQRFSVNILTRHLKTPEKEHAKSANN